MRLKDRIRRTNFGSFGAFVTAVLCVINIISGIVVAIVSKINGAEMSTYLLTIISYFINAIFYLSVCGTFIRGKSNFGQCYQAIMILCVCDFILPLIFGSFSGGVLIFFQIPSALFGVLYFAFLLVDFYKGRGKTVYSTLLIVFGALISAGALLSLAGDIYVFILQISSGTLSLTSYVNLICAIIISVFGFLETSLYLLYPIYLKRMRNKGY
jgi:hypothetical protein